MAVAAAQERYVELLLEKVREDRFPSGGLMDRIEASITTREQAQEYFDVLMEKVEDSRYPSGQLLDRIEHVAALARR